MLQLIFKNLILISYLIGAKPPIVEQPQKEPSAQQIKLANKYAKIITGMELIDVLEKKQKLAILQIETNPSLFIKMLQDSPSFFDIRIANFVSRISNEEEEPYAMIDDYQVALALAIRENRDFRDLFNKPFVIFNTESNYPMPNFDIQNRQFVELSSALQNTSLNFDKTHLNGNFISSGAYHDGIMSTQGFAMRFLQNGTNRRPVRAVYDMFLCSKIESYMDSSLSDVFVGPDISRNPGGNPHEYQEKCSGCHAVLDSQRGAFANYDDSGGNSVEKYVDVVTEKYNRNQQNNPDGEGYLTTDNFWVNPLSRPQDKERFGWRTQLTGLGVLSFSNMIVQSEQFQRCMTTKLIAEFCDRNPRFIRTSHKDFIALSNSMRDDGYKMKTLIQKIATSSYCR